VNFWEDFWGYFFIKNERPLKQGKTLTLSNAGRNADRLSSSASWAHRAHVSEQLHVRERPLIRWPSVKRYKFSIAVETPVKLNLFSLYTDVVIDKWQQTVTSAKRCTWVYALHDSTRWIFLSKNIFKIFLKNFFSEFLSRIFFQEFFILSPRQKRPYIQVRRYGYLQYQIA
jgi:hypothetical protein